MRKKDRTLLIRLIIIMLIIIVPSIYAHEYVHVLQCEEAGFKNEGIILFPDAETQEKWLGNSSIRLLGIAGMHICNGTDNLEGTADYNKNMLKYETGAYLIQFTLMGILLHTGICIWKKADRCFR